MPMRFATAGQRGHTLGRSALALETPGRPTPIQAQVHLYAIAAACFVGHFTTAGAAPICVHTNGEFQAALNAAGTGGGFNGQDTAIFLASGMYATAGSTFVFSTASGHALTIEGGYDDQCGVQNPMPGQTMLDGGGTDLVLELQSNGALDVRHLTIQHGFRHGGDGGAAQIVLTDAAAMAS